MKAIERTHLPVLASRTRRLFAYLERRRFVRTHLGAGIGGLTMVPEQGLVPFIAALDSVRQRAVPGVIVECGVWRGGTSFLAAQRLRQKRDPRLVWMFDSFEGLPPPRPIDGIAANAWANNPQGANYFDNCAASEEEVQLSAHRLGLWRDLRIVRGWFDATLHESAPLVGAIAVLRIDADWYDSVKLCLEEFYDNVSAGGIVILDDYHTWDGCTLAVHDFLSQRGLPHRIRTAGHTAYFEK